MDNTKWINTRVDVKLKKRYEDALKKAKEEIGRHVASPEIIAIGVKAFCDAAEKGKAEEFLTGKLK